MFQKPKTPAVWTEVHSQENNGQRRSFYFSDKGALKITRHTDRGEQIVTMLPGVALEDLAAIFPCELVEKLLAMHVAAQDTFGENKAKAKEVAKLERQKANEINKAERSMQALVDQASLIAKRLEDLKRPA